MKKQIKLIAAWALCLSIISLSAFTTANSTNNKETADKTAIQVAANEKKDKKEKIQVLLVGTFHFNNPGMDEHNTEIDDVYSKKRQKEIDEMNKGFADFKPNKIFTEMPAAAQAHEDSLYAQYLAGNFKIKDHKDGRSERFQVAYKLGKQLKHEQLYATDAEGLWLGSAVKGVAEELNMDFYAEDMKKAEASIIKEDSLMRLHTMKEIIYWHNTEEALMDNHNFYVAVSPRVITGEDDGKSLYYHNEENDGHYVRIDENYIGAELTAEWYTRNIKIYSNILKHVKKGEDKRIFVYYGQAHIRILKHLFEDNPDFEVVDALEYLK